MVRGFQKSYVDMERYGGRYLAENFRAQYRRGAVFYDLGDRVFMKKKFYWVSFKKPMLDRGRFLKEFNSLPSLLGTEW